MYGSESWTPTAALTFAGPLLVLISNTEERGTENDAILLAKTSLVNICVSMYSLSHEAIKGTMIPCEDLSNGNPTGPGERDRTTFCKVV